MVLCDDGDCVYKLYVIIIYNFDQTLTFNDY